VRVVQSTNANVREIAAACLCVHVVDIDLLLKS
jgi:hypothetical protein